MIMKMIGFVLDLMKIELSDKSSSFRAVNFEKKKSTIFVRKKQRLKKKREREREFVRCLFSIVLF